jgi:hypothetical protein
LRQEERGQILILLRGGGVEIGDEMGRGDGVDIDFQDEIEMSMHLEEDMGHQDMMCRNYWYLEFNDVKLKERN